MLRFPEGLGECFTDVTDVPFLLVTRTETTPGFSGTGRSWARNFPENVTGKIPDRAFPGKFSADFFQKDFRKNLKFQNPDVVRFRLVVPGYIIDSVRCKIINDNPADAHPEHIARS